MIHGIILAGGKASRVKKNKLLLDFKGRPIIYHTVKSMSSVCDKITIVTGFYQEIYLPYLEEFLDVNIVHNPLHETGMFSSVLEGIKGVNEDCFIIPGDSPLVNHKTYKQLLASNGGIRVPSYNYKAGHPIFLEKQMVLKLQQEEPTSNLKTFRNKHKVHYVNVDDPGILFDIDYIEDYEKLISDKGSE